MTNKSLKSIEELLAPVVATAHPYIKNKNGITCDTIEDEMPAMSAAFHKRVAEEGGICTPYGIVQDPSKPRKKHTRLAKAMYAQFHWGSKTTVEAAEQAIHSWSIRRKSKPDWESGAAAFGRVLGVSFKYRNKQKPNSMSGQKFTPEE